MTKTCCILLISLLFISSIVRGQNTGGYEPIVKRVALDSIPLALPKTNLPFSRIEVIDSRLDNSKIGYMYLANENAYSKIVTRQNFAAALQSSLMTACKDQLNASANRTLVIVIKSLWLQETTKAELKKQKVSRDNEMEFGICRSFLETYALENNSYTPLFRADTCFQSEYSLYDDAELLLAQTFSDVLAKASSPDINKLISLRKKLKWSDIKNYNDKRLAFPRFANDTIVRGIYPTFRDFMNNTPLLKEFTVEAGKLTDELYIIENKDTILADKCWGFCDGKKNYVRVGYNFFELTRQMNTYELWGTKTSIVRNAYIRPAGGSSPLNALVLGLIGSAVSNASKSTMEGDYKPMQVNMETGEVY